MNLGSKQNATTVATPAYVYREIYPTRPTYFKQSSSQSTPPTMEILPPVANFKAGPTAAALTLTTTKASTTTASTPQPTSPAIYQYEYDFTEHSVPDVADNEVNESYDYKYDPRLDDLYILEHPEYFPEVRQVPTAPKRDYQDDMTAHGNTLEQMKQDPWYEIGFQEDKEPENKAPQQIFKPEQHNFEPEQHEFRPEPRHIATSVFQRPASHKYLESDLKEGSNRKAEYSSDGFMDDPLGGFQSRSELMPLEALIASVTNDVDWSRPIRLFPNLPDDK